MPAEFRASHLLKRVAQLAAVVIVVVIAINALPGLDEVKRASTTPTRSGSR